VNAVTSNSTIRTMALALLNLVVATVGTGLAEGAFWRQLHVWSLRMTPMLMENLVSSATAFGLGYSIYAQWQPAVSKWLWIAGLCWFIPHALLMLGGSDGSVLEPAGTNFPADSQDITNWVAFTIPCLRTIFYSLGAFCSARTGGPALLQGLKDKVRKTW
jgi:hypothetical protein